MQSKLQTEAEFFVWVRGNMAAKLPELVADETLARFWPPRPGIKEPFNGEEAHRAFQREDLHWIPMDFQGVPRR